MSNSPRRSRPETKRVAAEGIDHGRKRFVTRRIVNRVALRIDSIGLEVTTRPWSKLWMKARSTRSAKQVVVLLCETVLLRRFSVVWYLFRKRVDG